ncbi:hypothetical protein CXF35_00770 [Corynebacterium bovis]|uniref:Uncharacterized protein n=1 Tax=Corynebacterium bovis TaxID=36808 RepID=A0A3R8QHG8_9CORY|nr:hypothetical protein CXF40_03165 [Corynebacterium bovis]RRO98630.1 hypothetical protein CXF32_00335 [Corynebacterium bovis]RRO99677.1 hypothetical protein CXF41_08955 [Corynebacterium bovis]RRQ00433.1 hypothetical protein CXF31_00770 [Corynebacterium bovis]RRQ03543.1 hypothetical protein CXF42_06985 [Corynebacterium bovis]
MVAALAWRRLWVRAVLHAAVAQVIQWSRPAQVPRGVSGSMGSDQEPGAVWVRLRWLAAVIRSWRAVVISSASWVA